MRWVCVVVAAAAGATGVAGALEADFPAAPICPSCSAAEAVPVDEPAFEAAAIAVWECPNCGQYYWGGGWHAAADFTAERQRLESEAGGIPSRCPKCGGKLVVDRAFVAHTAAGEEPCYSCYRCWTMVLPDGSVMSADEVAAMEAERIAGVEKKRVADLAREYGWSEEKTARILAGRVAVGDEGAAVREAWGHPAKVEREMTLRGGIRETWYYADGRTVDLKDGVVTSFGN